MPFPLFLPQYKLSLIQHSFLSISHCECEYLRLFHVTAESDFLVSGKYNQCNIQEMYCT